MKTSKDPIEICEEATFLLRNARAVVWTRYLMGTMPFLLGLLYFWSDMTRGTPSRKRLMLESLGLAALFVWMKCGQALFAEGLRNTLAGVPVSRSKLGRLIWEQARWQPWGLIVLPLSAILTIPLGWTFAYYQNLTVLGARDGESENIHSRAVAQAKLWPAQNHWLLLIAAGVFLFVFVNVLVLLLLAPRILITFFGVKELFEPSVWLALNTTFLALVFVITHLIMDPFVKAIYTLRCYYGESVQTGEDLRVRLKHLRHVAALLLVLCFAGRASAATPETLDTRIEQVLKKPEYSWKLPRELAPEGERAPIGAFFDNLARMLTDGLKAVFNRLGQVIDWIRNLFRGKESASSEGGWSFGDPQALLYAVLAVCAVGLFVVFWRSRRARQNVQAPVTATPVSGPVDLGNEEVGADALPEDEWLKLAAQLQAQGDLRLAIRALFLAALADLARRELVSLAKFKSNRDYERELRRRSLAAPQRTSSFAGLVAVYERIWYGMYEPSGEIFTECDGTVRFLRTC